MLCNFDLENKKYESRDGKYSLVALYPGRLPDYPLIAIYKDKKTKKHQSMTVTARGYYSAEANHTEYDIVEVKPRIQRTGWLNVYPHFSPIAYDTKAIADKAASKDRLACIQITIDCEEGEGL